MNVNDITPFYNIFYKSTHEHNLMPKGTGNFGIENHPGILFGKFRIIFKTL